VFSVLAPWWPSQESDWTEIDIFLVITYLWYIWATGRNICVVPALCLQMAPLSCPRDCEILSRGSHLCSITSLRAQQSKSRCGDGGQQNVPQVNMTNKMTFSQGKMGILCHLCLPVVHFCIESQQSKGGGKGLT
jgi:hypothetical protein